MKVEDEFNLSKTLLTKVDEIFDIYKQAYGAPKPLCREPVEFYLLQEVVLMLSKDIKEKGYTYPYCPHCDED